MDESPGFVRNEVPVRTTGEQQPVMRTDLDTPFGRVHRPRPMKLDHQSGEWSPDPERESFYEVKTWWRSFDDFVAWTTSPSFREAHADRPPKEMFAGKNVLEVHEVFLSTDEGDR